MKKRLLVVVTLVLVAVLVLTLVACGGNTEQNTDNSTSTPPSGQTPDSGDGDNEGEITPPENPGGEIGEPEDPKDPDDDGEVTDPDDGNEGEDPETPEQPAFVVDTVEKLLEYRSATLYDYLMENYASTVVTKLAGRGAILDNAEQFEWAITGTESETLTEFQVRFVYHTNASYMYYVGAVIPIKVITVNDILTGNIQEISTFYKYSCNAIEANIEQNRPLAEAIITALGETFSPEDTILMTMDIPTTDPQWSWKRICYVKQITGTAVNEYSLVVKAESATDEDGIKQLIENIETGKCKNGAVEKNVVTFETGVTADSVDKALPDATA